MIKVNTVLKKLIIKLNFFVFNYIKLINGIKRR
jgi:hypothetical protein